MCVFLYQVSRERNWRSLGAHASRVLFLHFSDVKNKRRSTRDACAPRLGLVSRDNEKMESRNYHAFRRFDVNVEEIGAWERTRPACSFLHFSDVKNK
jgi:hypothetical protein